MDNTILATIILGGTGILITAYYSWHTKKLSHEQMLKQLFTEFNQRYRELNDHLKEIEDNYESLMKLNESDKADFLKQKVNDYFSLCAEEYFWYHHKNRIDKVIWESWHSGMNYWYQNVPAIKELWQLEIKSNGVKSYYISNVDDFFIEK